MAIIEGPFQHVTSLFKAGESPTDIVMSMYDHTGDGEDPVVPAYNLKLSKVDIFLTLLTGEWVASPNTFTVLSSFTATTSPTNGFNDLISGAFGGILRVSDTVIKCTFALNDSYDVTLAETIEFNPPESLFDVTPDTNLKGYPSIITDNGVSVPAGSTGFLVDQLNTATGSEHIWTASETLSHTAIQAMFDGPEGIWTVPDAGFKIDIRLAETFFNLGSDPTQTGMQISYENAAFLFSSWFSYFVRSPPAPPADGQIGYRNFGPGNIGYAGSDRATFWSDRGVTVASSMIYYKPSEAGTV